MEPEAYDELYRLEAGHWWYQGMRQITDRLLATVLDGRTDLHILDAGCGTGGNLKALSRYGRVVGFDYSPLAVAYASQEHAGRLARASVEALPYADNTFDLVTSFDVLVCYEVKEDVGALRELARVTRPGGHVLVRLAALPALRGPHDAFVHGARRYVASELRAKLVAAGLDALRVTYANSLLMPLIFAVRQAQNLVVRRGWAAGGSDVKAAAGPVHWVLRSLLGLEARWIGAGRGFPAGVSLFGLAVKPV